VNRIVYAGGDGHIYTIDPDGKRRIQVSPVTGPGFPGGQFTWPVWSPDGGEVLFSSVLEAQGGGADVSLVRAPALGGEQVTIYSDDPLSGGIGSGVPHFAMWSPDGEQVALIAGTGQGLVTLIIDSHTGDFLQGIGFGSPVYFAWSPDSQFLVVHLEDTLFMYELGANGARGRRSVQLSNPTFNYYAPQFAPSDNRFAYGGDTDAGRRVLVWAPNGAPVKDVGKAPGILGFRWSPDGTRLAVVRGPDEGLFETVTLISLSDGAEKELLRRRVYGFWWSPDGTKLAVAAVSDSYRLCVDWLIVDVASGRVTPLAVNFPTNEFRFVLSFFDQYGNASQIWSPDSQSIVVAGAILPAATPPTGELPAPPVRSETERVWVLDVSASAGPRAVGDGFLAFWSPK